MSDNGIHCPGCGNRSPTGTVKCGFCGRLLLAARWQRIVYELRQLQEPSRSEYWSKLTDEQRRILTAADAALPAARWLGESECIICPNPSCGFQGPAIVRDKANVGLGCLLMFLLLVPGILYFMVMAGRDYSCPNCGVQIRTTH